MPKPQKQKDNPSEKEPGSDLGRFFRCLVLDRYISDSVYVADRTGRIVYANEEAARCAGKDQDELIGSQIEDVHGSRAHDFDWPEIWHQVQERGGHCLEENHEHIGGNRFPVVTRFFAEEYDGEPFVVAVAHDVSEKNGLLESLQVARDRATQYFELAELIFLVLSPKGDIMDINRTGAEILGVSKKEVIGQSWIEAFIPVDDRAATQRILEDVKAENPKVKSGENFIVRQDGRRLAIFWHNSVLKDDHGEIIAVLAAGVDVTERRRAEEMARQRNRLNQHLVSLTAEYMVNGDFGYLVESMLQVLGQSIHADRGGLGQVIPGQPGVVRYQHEWTNGDLPEIFSDMGDLPVEGMEITGEILKNGHVWSVDDCADLDPQKSREAALVHKYGVKSLLVAPLPSAGDLFGTLLFTRERQAAPWSQEQVEMVKQVASLLANAVARDQSLQELSETQSRLSDISESLRVGIYRNTPGPQGHFLEANQAIVDMFEADSKEELMSHSVSDLYWNPEKRKDFSDKLRRHGRLDGEVLELKTLKGRKIWARLSVVMKTDENGQAYFDGVIDDITAEKATELKSRQLDDLKNTFIQVVSHQVRTPLNSIRWSLETLMAEELGGLTVSQKDFLRVVYSAETEILSRLDDMLTALDIEEGRLVFRKSHFDLRGLWSSVSVGLQRECKIKGIELSEDVAGQPLEAEIDAERMRKVFVVLVSNAVDYTKSGGKISVRLHRQGDRIRFEVQDSGVGIPSAEQSRVFERFYRASNAAVMKPDATGLGLAIANYYVEQHSGEMGFASQEGEGTTFWFELPIA